MTSLSCSAAPAAPSPAVSSALAAIASERPESKPAAYAELLSTISAADPSAPTAAADHAAFFSSLLATHLSPIATRPLVERFVTRLRVSASGSGDQEAAGGPLLPAEKVAAVGTQALEAFRTNATGTAAQEASVRFAIADALERDEEFAAAGRVLMGVNLDATTAGAETGAGAAAAPEGVDAGEQERDRQKAAVLIRVVRLFLEDDDATSAETALNRLKSLATLTTLTATDPELRLHYTLSQARIHDSNRRFLDAAAAYSAIASATTLVDESDRHAALAAAVTAAILAPAGPSRARALARLYNDDRARSTGAGADVTGSILPDTHRRLLEDIFFDRLIGADEVAAFAATLAPHQLAPTADGSTVLARAMLEHNVLAASRLYANVSVDALARILAIESDDEGKTKDPGEAWTAGEKAEAVAARMVEQGRLSGHIDQLAGVIYFDDMPNTTANSSTAGDGPEGGADAPVGKAVGAHVGYGGISWPGELRSWEGGVQGVAEEVERVAAAVGGAVPEFAERVRMEAQAAAQAA